MGDRRISRKPKRKVFISCVTPAYIYGLKAMKETVNKKLVRNRLRWAGSIERMGDEK